MDSVLHKYGYHMTQLVYRVLTKIKFALWQALHTNRKHANEFLLLCIHGTGCYYGNQGTIITCTYLFKFKLLSKSYLNTDSMHSLNVQIDIVQMGIHYVLNPGFGKCFILPSVCLSVAYLNTYSPILFFNVLIYYHMQIWL